MRRAKIEHNQQQVFEVTNPITNCWHILRVAEQTGSLFSISCRIPEQMYTLSHGRQLKLSSDP